MFDKETLCKGPKEYFKELKQKTGLTYKQLAQEIGVSVYALKQLESMNSYRVLDAWSCSRVLAYYENKFGIKLPARDIAELICIWRRRHDVLTGGQPFEVQYIIWKIMNNTVWDIDSLRTAVEYIDKSIASKNRDDITDGRVQSVERMHNNI